MLALAPFLLLLGLFFALSQVDRQHSAQSVDLFVFIFLEFVNYPVMLDSFGVSQ